MTLLGTPCFALVLVITSASHSLFKLCYDSSHEHPCNATYISFLSMQHFAARRHGMMPQSIYLSHLTTNQSLEKLMQTVYRYTAIFSRFSITLEEV